MSILSISSTTLSNFLLICASVSSLYFTNSPTFSKYYNSLLSQSFGALSIKEWICDFLMTFFLLSVALDLKKDFFTKDTISKSVLPMIAAFGGMVVPAVIFLLINFGIQEHYKAFAVPCATDIAFAMGAFNAIFGDSKELKSAKMFLLALATFDDIGAILLIATCYNKDIMLSPLIFTIIGMLVLFYTRRSQNFFAYLSSGILIWVGLYSSGIHTTLAGVIIGMSLPNTQQKGLIQFSKEALSKIVPLLILPIFAFSACNIDLTGFQLQDLSHRITLGVFLGLFLGKQIGIFCFTFIIVKVFSIKVESISWWEIYCISVLGGIGFTMSLFVGELSFANKESLNLVKTGLVLGSLSSILWGFCLIKTKNLYLGNKC